jgi:hypothetical protein
MNAPIALDRSSVAHPLLVALRAAGAPDCVLTATTFASTPLSPLSPAPCTPLRHPFRLLPGILDATRHRTGLPVAAVQASNVPRFPHSA